MAVALLFTASCAKEDISSSIAGGEVEVTFTASLPELGTRAFGEGKLAKELTVKVFESTTNEALTALDRTVTSNTGVFTFQLVLLKGMKYDIVLWAQNATCGHYTLANKVVTMNYTDVNANDETRDAFYFYVEGFDPAVDTPSFALTRPFAQLNAAVNQSDMTAVSNSKVELTTSTVKVKTYTTLNIATGEVGGETEVEFVPTAMPKEIFNTDYTLLSMNYILVPQTANGKMLSNVEFTFNATKNGSETAFTGTSYQDVPLKRNYRTNILGSLLTKPTDFEVKIEADFFEPDQKPEELFMAAVLGGEVTLTEDVELTQPLNVQSTMTLNLNGHTITTTEESAGRHYYAIYNNGNLTITGSGNINARGIKNFGEMVVDGDLTITNVDTDGGAAIWNEGKLTINKGTFATNNNAGQGSYGAALNTRANGEAVVNGGNFYAYSQLTYAIINEGTTTINNAVVKGKHGAVSGASSTATNIYGGSFELLENPGVSDHCTYYVSAIYGGTFSLGNNTDSGAKVFYESNIAAGYKAVLIDNWYRVLPEVIADAAVAANVTAVTESTADVATALATNNGEATMFMWNDVAYIAKYGEVIIISAADEATTSRGVVEYAASLTSATVAEGVEVVGNRTFRKCANLETVALPNTLTEIGPAVFQSCSKLANVTIPASVTTIGEGAFQECSSLESINIPAGVTRIESDCLRATGLVEVEFHADVTYFGAQAFRDCKQLKKVTINAPVFTIEPNAFGVMAGALPGTVIYVANAEMKAYLESTLSYISQFEIVAPEAPSNATELDEALNNGKNVILSDDLTFSASDTTANSGYGATGVTVDGSVLDGNGNTLTVNDAWGTWDCAVNPVSGTIKNLTVSGAMRGIFMGSANGDVYIDNVIFDNVVYTFNSDGGNKNYGVYISNCTINGWTSHSDVHKEVVYTNCSFGQGNGYAFCRPYGPTVYKNCEFSTDMKFDTSQSTVIVFKNCTYGGVKITADNAASLKTGETTFFYNGVGSASFE